MEYGNNVDSTAKAVSGGTDSTKPKAASKDYQTPVTFCLPFEGYTAAPNLQRKINKQ